MCDARGHDASLGSRSAGPTLPAGAVWMLGAFGCSQALSAASLPLDGTDPTRQVESRTASELISLFPSLVIFVLESCNNGFFSFSNEVLIAEMIDVAGREEPRGARLCPALLHCVGSAGLWPYGVSTEWDMGTGGQGLCCLHSPKPSLVPGALVRKASECSMAVFLVLLSVIPASSFAL